MTSTKLILEMWNRYVSGEEEAPEEETPQHKKAYEDLTQIISLLHTDPDPTIKEFYEAHKDQLANILTVLREYSEEDEIEAVLYGKEELNEIEVYMGGMPELVRAISGVDLPMARGISFLLLEGGLMYFAGVIIAALQNLLPKLSADKKKKAEEAIESLKKKSDKK